jgi:sarcosine oxidase
MRNGMRVVVVGAGVLGGWTARWLRRRGHRVTLVDQDAPGSSHATSGGETRVTRSAHGGDELYPGWQRRALSQWRELQDTVHERLWVPTGVLWFAHRPDGFEAESLATLTRLGIPAEHLDPSDLAARWPQVSTDDLGWALWEPEAGALMARRSVAALADLLGAEGATLVRGRVLPPDASDLADEGARLYRLRLADGTELPADAIVFAAGPWLPKLLPGLFDGLLAVTRQEYVYLATPPGDARFDAGAMPTWCDYDRACYGLPSIEGRGCKFAPDWPGPEIDPDTQERRLSDDRVEASRAFAATRFPLLAAQPVVEGRVCQYSVTPDTHFILDRHPRWENAWIAGGGSGHAFKHAPTIGEYVAALVDEDEALLAAIGPRDGRFALRPRQPAPGMRTSGARPEG